MACSRARTAGENFLPVLFEPREERRIAEQSVFGDLGIAGAELALRQRVEQRGIGNDQDRLMEGADQVLALKRIDAGFAADRGVNLRQQRRRHLHKVEAASHARGSEPGKVPDHATTERQHKIAPLDMR